MKENFKRSPFVLKDHVSIDWAIEQKKTAFERLSSLSNWFWNNGERERLSILIDQLEDTKKQYSKLEKCFESIKNYSDSQVYLVEGGKYIYGILIEGRGLKRGQIHVEDGEESISSRQKFIPFTLDQSNISLTFMDEMHPPYELTSLDAITIDYEYQSFIELPFSKKPFDFQSPSSFFNCIDSPSRLMFDTVIPWGVGGNRFSLTKHNFFRGDVYLNKTHIYSGNLECFNNPFPYFHFRDDGKGSEKKPTFPPTSGISKGPLPKSLTDLLQPNKIKVLEGVE